MERGFQPSQPTPWSATVKTVAPYRLTLPRDRATLQTFKKSFVLVPFCSSVLSLLTHLKLHPPTKTWAKPATPSHIFAATMRSAIYTYHFRRYLGRNLTRAEAAVIGPLEKMRIRGLERRLLVVDPPGVDTRGILCAYVEYLRKKVNPRSDILIMTQRKEMSLYIAKRLRTPDTVTIAATGHRPENIRGLTYDTALLLDIQDYGICSPARKRNDFHRVATAVFPVISSNPNSLLILHARAAVPHLYRWPGLKEYTDPSLAPPDVPIKKPDPTVPIIIPLKIEQGLWNKVWNKGFSPLAGKLPPHPRPL